MTDRSLSLSDFLCLFGDCLDAARFAESITPNLLLLHPDGSWWRREGNALKATEPPATLAVAREALAHPSTQRRHSDYCPHSRVARGETYANNSPVLLCSCPPEVRDREDRRRQADPLLRAVDAVGEATP